MSKLLLLSTAMLCLTACGTIPGSCELLVVKEYDKPFTLRLVGEVGATPLDSATREYLVDQTALRDAVHACKGG